MPIDWDSWSWQDDRSQFEDPYDPQPPHAEPPPPEDFWPPPPSNNQPAPGTPSAPGLPPWLGTPGGAEPVPPQPPWLEAPDLPDWYDPGTGTVGGDDTGDPGFELPGPPSGPPPAYNLPDLPEFNPTMFSAPSFEDAQNEPGYQFRLQSGADALERSAAARGVLRTGGTLKDVLEYGQNFGAQEYNNVFNRALQAYGATYQAEKDMYAPKFAEWQFGVNADHDARMAAYQREYDVWATQVEAALRREQMIQNAMMMPPPSGDYV